MTEERRHRIRRSDDKELAAAVEELLDLQEMDHTRLEKLETAFYETMLGPVDHLGNRKLQEGMVHKVDYVYKKLANGGIQVKLSPGLWALLLTVVAGIFSIGAAIVTRM